jgi:hypothetical protein
MLTKLRLVGAFSALLMAVIGGAVGGQSGPPAPTVNGTVQLRSTALPMETPETTMKSPIVATTDPRPFDACEDIPFDVIQRLGLGFTPPEHEDGLRCHFDAGNYQLAVEPIIWRTYAASLPPDALETDIGGHRAAQFWVEKPTYHNSFWFFSCMVAFKTSYGLIQQALYYSTVYSNPNVDCMATNLQRANDLVPYYKF